MAYVLSKPLPLETLIRTRSTCIQCNPKRRPRWAAATPLRPQRPTEWNNADAASDDAEKEPSVESISETMKNPMMNSQILDAMRDYFGDDGREVEEYTSRPKNEDGMPQFRVAVIGSSEKEVAVAKVLMESGRVFGLYYCTEDVEDGYESKDRMNYNTLAVSKYCNYVKITEPKDEQVFGFCQWARVDAVFAGSDHDYTPSKELESDLAKHGVTFFARDVSAAVVSGDISVHDCFSGLTKEYERKQSERARVVE